MENPLGMSDEDFMNLNKPAVEPPAVVATTTATVEPTTTTEPVVESTVEEEAPAVETAVVEPTVTTTVPIVETKSVVAPTTKTAVTAATTEETPVEKPVDPVPVTATTGTGEATPPDYKAIYEKFMAPLKANGKTIELKTPEEAIQLMQMGANYTKKMQAITPYRKVLAMLENNSLLDENRLSFLIDLDKKNPDAIKKLVKDSGIDPLDFDAESKTTYLEGNHRVTDEEVGFKSAVEDLRSNPQGIETLREINDWDQASKEVLWKQPELMTVIHSQRENGIYRQIQTEIDRRRTLGTLSANTPFLSAYQAVGNELAAAGAFNRAAPTTTTPVAGQGTVTTPVATRVAASKPAVVNSDRVSAASTTRSTPRTAGKFVNPLAMSDDDFLKQMAERV